MAHRHVLVVYRVLRTDCSLGTPGESLVVSVCNKASLVKFDIRN